MCVITIIIISILDVLLTETTLVTKANPDSVRIWDRYRRGPRFVRILDWSNLGPPHRYPNPAVSTHRCSVMTCQLSRGIKKPVVQNRGRSRDLITTDALRYQGVNFHVVQIFMTNMKVYVQSRCTYKRG